MVALMIDEEVRGGLVLSAMSPVGPAGAGRGIGDEIEIVHAIPGRVRVRCMDSAIGRGLASRLRQLSAVRSVAWRESIRSLTVAFEPDTEWDTLLVQASSVPVAVELVPSVSQPARPRWQKILLPCLLALVPLGPVGSVVLAAATSVASARAEAAVAPS